MVKSNNFLTVAEMLFLRGRIFCGFYHRNEGLFKNKLAPLGATLRTLSQGSLLDL